MLTCPACGEENPERFKLCGFCGTPLVRAAPPPEVRKTVTVVFSDLKGSTDLAEHVDPESVRELLNRYFDEMRQVLERHGGVVEKYIGDAIMAVFGLPRVHEDDALRAVRATADMQRALVELNAELHGTWGVRLANRTGVNTGEVVAGDAAGGQRLVTGDAVNVAARLEQAAGELQVLLGESTYRLVRHRVDVEPLEPLRLKGKSRPVPAYRLLAVHEADRSLAKARSTQVVGRALEAARLIQEFELAVSRRSCELVTVLGEAGIGKSRLIDEFCRIVGPEARVLRGRCLAYGRGITFWPLVEVVRQAAGIGDEDLLPTARAKLAAALGAGGEAAADRIASAIGLADRQFPVEEVYWGTRKLLEQLARQRPLVVVVEDVHWAESALLDLIDRLVSMTTDAPVLLVCAARPEFAERRPRWLERGDSVVALEPLSGEQTAAVLDNLLGDADLDLTARRAVVGASDGNPLFAEQLLSMLIEDGYLRREDGRWVRTRDLTALALPPTIHALLSARLDLLADDERGVIEPASVIGGVFEVSAVEALAAAPVREALPNHLRSLEGKQLIEAEGPPVPDRDLTFRFHHILIRDAAYQGLLKRTRAALHERFADWLEGVSGERDREVEFEEILGYHLEQARRYLSELGPVDDHGRDLGVRAAARLGAAGRRAFSRADMPAAANLLRRAVMLLPPEHPTRLGLLPVLGEALMEIGEFPWAILFLDEAVELSRDQPRLNADLVLTRLLVGHHVAENLERWREEVRREAERLIPVLQEQNADAQLAKAWRLLGFVHGSVCRYGEAALAVREAMQHARRAGDARLEARNASAYTLAALYGPTPAAEAIEQCEQLAAQGLTDRQAEALVLCSLAQLRAMQGDFARARELLRSARTLLEDLGVIVLAAATAMHHARIELLGGDLGIAEAELRRAYDTLTGLGERYLLPPVAALLAQVVYAQGRADEAEEISRTAEELTAADDVEAQALWRSVRAKVFSGRDLAEEAEGLAREAVRLIRTTDSPGMQADALLDLAEVLRRSARPDEARVIADEARGLYQEKGNLVGVARATAVVAALPR
ncbi:MAG: adenylate/guanylate cyclase domain-containing protein [Mycobacteriales bacterium]